MTDTLFSPITLRGLTMPNRIAISPMCQYSAEDGSASDWHMIHLGHLSLSGAGLLIVEAAAVEARGRITPHCLGLYSDANEAALERVLAACRKYGNTPMAIQFAHAGRKASTHRPWEGRHALGADEGAWQTVAPSAIPFGANWHTPQALDRAGMNEIKAAFLTALERADRLGFDLVELHSAHGYLFSEFLSPIANYRTDEYGGNLENRMRFPLEVIAAARDAWPADKPLGVRFSGTDWEDERGWTPEDSVVYARALKAIGVDYVDVSSGGNSPARIPLGPGYQVPLAAKVKAEAGITTMAVGMITEPRQAEQIVASSQADIVALARGMLYDPRWPWRAAEALGAEAAYPPQYARAEPSRWPEAFPDRRAAE